MNILQFRGDTDPYLRHPPGTAGLDFLRMARPGLLPDLRDGIEAARTGGAVRRPGVRVGEGEGARRVTLLITPLAGGGPGLLCFLIVFEDEAATPTPPLPPIPVDADLAEQVTRLERELDSCREHQQAVVEEYEAANEELKSANEEILASNEELQSANEELQQTKEEMQSANEELETVNEELGQRNRELGRVNDDLNSLLLGVNVPVVIVGRDLRLRRVTSQAEEAFGLLPADAGRSLREVRLETVLADRGPPQRLDLEGTVARVISTLEAATFEAQDRHGRWYAVRVRPYETGDNRIDGAVITAMDIDAMKRAEAARHDLEAKMFQTQKLESLGVLAGGVAHDLNNLLTPVIGYADLARDALPAGSPARAFLEEVAQHTREATAVVQQLLVYAGRSQRDVGIRDLSQLVRNLDKLLERAAASSSSLQTGVPEYLHTRPPLWGAELRFELTATPLPVEVDATQVAQVVLNLVTNGAEAMLQRTKSAGLLHDTLPERTAEGGRGVVTIRTTALQADRAALSSPYLETNDLAEGAYAVLEVSDTGAGMDAATLARMFDPFFTTKFTGRGLGLAAVLGIVRSHRGTLTVRSEPGRGTTVRVLLPLLDRLVPAPPVAEGVPLADWRGSGTVLLVDDERSVRGLTSVILHRAGFVVLEAADGNEGLALFHAHANEVRVVVTDLTMPGMDGLALAAALRAERPTLPILVMSGYGDEAIPGSPSDQQVSGFLQKPFVPGSLLEALRNVLADS